MAAAENRAMAARWFGDAYAGRLAIADDLFAPDFVLNGERIGAAGQKESLAEARRGFPDIRVETLDEVVTDDAIVRHNVIRGTHTGTFNGIPPTGKQVEIHSTIIWHIANGKVVRDWTILDQFSLLQQLGVLPAAIS